MNKSVEFLEMIDRVWNAPIPEEVMARARRSLLDYLAVTCAGAEFQRDKLKNYLAFAEPETGSFRAIGTGKDLALKEAVFLNGLNGHALDFDDGTNSGIIHLGSPIFSLLIPLAQRYTAEELARMVRDCTEIEFRVKSGLQSEESAMDQAVMRILAIGRDEA